MVFPVTQFSPYTSLFSFLIGLPAMIGGPYYQSWKARQEARQAREGAMQSMNCLEFVVDDRQCQPRQSSQQQVQLWPARWRRVGSLRQR